ncbi:hypothetical protein MLD38_030971 [Melastoma candidum]|uniref:Uncharacterized protein n=1 Tax=Melastoma candidum TaxID=119954 RepID=A0ACB9MPI6_9MYRT|nr:hypothetical protein MLD38_030971 [Melastoma candidum]
MLCLELWYNAILVLLAGYMKNASVAISAFSICLSISTWEFMICLGFLVGVSVQPVFSGVAVGCGRQGMVAWVNIGSYYMIGIPLGVVLGYVANLDVQGIWIGMIIGVAIQTLVLGTIIWRTNWDAQVEKAAERLSKWFLQKPEDDEPEDSAQEAPNGR